MSGYKSPEEQISGCCAVYIGYFLVVAIPLALLAVAVVLVLLVVHNVW